MERSFLPSEGLMDPVEPAETAAPPSAPQFWLVSSSEFPRHCLYELGNLSYSTLLGDGENFCIRNTSSGI